MVGLLKFNVSLRHCYGPIGDTQNPEPGDNPQLLPTPMGLLDICNHRHFNTNFDKPVRHHCIVHVYVMSTPQQPAHDSNPENYDDESNTICLPPPSDDNDCLEARQDSNLALLQVWSTFHVNWRQIIAWYDFKMWYWASKKQTWKQGNFEKWESEGLEYGYSYRILCKLYNVL